MSDVAELLERSARRRELHHAIILQGPSHEALRDLAVHLGRITLCPSRSGDDSCASCGKVDRGTHPDFHLIEVGEEKKLISVEQIRQIIAEASLRPYEGEAKVFIVDGADLVSPGAANALLKTLEEPPADTFFFLLTRSADLLLPTVRSRSQAIQIGPSGAAARSRASLGTLGDASEQWSRFVLQRIASFATGRDIAALLEIASTLAAIEPVEDAVAILLTALRDAAGDYAQSDDRDSIAAIRAHLSPATLLDAATLALESNRRLAVNTDTRLLFEQIVLTLAL